VAVVCPANVFAQMATYLQSQKTNAIKPDSGIPQPLQDAKGFRNTNNTRLECGRIFLFTADAMAEKNLIDYFAGSITG
jgi:hypothetical protein